MAQLPHPIGEGYVGDEIHPQIEKVDVGKGRNVRREITGEFGSAQYAGHFDRHQVRSSQTSFAQLLSRPLAYLA